jgi:hypothetical protein
LGKIWKALEWNRLFYFMTIWKHFVVIWFNLYPFATVCGHLVCLDQDKSGIPVMHHFAIRLQICKLRSTTYI